MSEPIVIQLKSAAAEKQGWIVFSENRTKIAGAEHSSLSEISPHCEHRNVVVLLPATEVVLLEVTLPLLKKSKLMQALPFAIEEQLSEKVSAYHLTILGDQEASGVVHVAVIEKSHLQNWYTLLREHNIRPMYFIPTLLALPFQEDTLTILSNYSTG